MRVLLFKNVIGTLIVNMFLYVHMCLNFYESKHSYSLFRTMGLRHLVVVDGDHKVTGMITRHDITEHRLEHHWFKEVIDCVCLCLCTYICMI